MYVGSYDAPVRDLCSYAARLEELVLLGFTSTGLEIRWEEHPRDLPADERDAVAVIVRDHGLELRLHPDLGKLHKRGQERGEDLLPWVKREMEPVIEWGLDLGVASICCDSIRELIDETVAVFRLLIEMTRGTDLCFGVENSQRGVINSPAKMNEAVDRVGDPRMGVLLDVGHINTTIGQGWIDCASPEAFIRQLRVPIWDTHFHTNGGCHDDHLPVSDPSGTLDLREVVAALHQQGYAGPLNLECTRKTRRCTLGAMEDAVLADRRHLEGLLADQARPQP